jgi:hypothetical protein
MELSLDSRPEPTPVNIQGDSEFESPHTNPLRRAVVGEPGLSDQVTRQGETQAPSRSRRLKAIYGGSFVPRDPDFDRKPSMVSGQNGSNERISPQKRLFDPNSDRTTLAPNIRKAGKIDGPVPSRHVCDARSHLFRSPKDGPEDKDHPRGPSRPTQPFEIDKLRTNSGRSVGYSFHLEMPDHGDSDTYLESSPELLLQPETRPISHEQLVIEVKGIYAGLIMVESKCIDVDDEQTIAATEKDPLKQTKLNPEQWQALIALHKTLLHEHHDFFLASHHPLASPALNRLAAKYSMPGRMWRHGIHAFLEVLRHRLPDSFDHMLAFIYIAYSMMALLYETVPTFEDTWIDCLGDLGRYRMAIEDDGIWDRDVWVATSKAMIWYRKAADKKPKIGRLYHHLANLARPYTLQQLSIDTHLLTCVEPLESTKASVMTLFNPNLDNKEFTKPKEGDWRPLPEDFLIRGQLWSESYFPLTWFSETSVDDEERSLELPSMSASRTERMRWLGHSIAAPERWLSYDQDSGNFIVTQDVQTVSDKYKWNSMLRKLSKIHRRLGSFVNGSRLSALADTGAAKNVKSAAYVKPPQPSKEANLVPFQPTQSSRRTDSGSPKKFFKTKRGLSSFVNGSRLSVLADTGAAKNIISAAYVKEREIPISFSPSSFRLGNSVNVNSIGTVTVDYAFAEEPSNIHKLICHVLPHCVYDLILGNAFLTATETMSKFRRRLTECVFSVVNMFHLGFLGNNSLQLEGVLADMYDVTATPDTGAERNVIDFE